MRWLLILTALTVASAAFAQCPNGQCAPVQASVTYKFTVPPPQVRYVQAPAPVVQYALPPVVTYSAPILYAAPMPAYYAAPVLVERKRYATPVRDFFFGR